MNLTHENFRFMILYNFKCNLSVQQSLAWLKTTFDDEAPSKTAIYSWFAEFNYDYVNHSAEFRENRPSTAVHHLIETNNYVTT